MKEKLPIVALISGFGSNLQAIIDAMANGLAVDIKAVISNQPDAYGLKRAEQAGIPTQVIDHRAFKNRDAFDAALADCISSYQPKLIVLAGFMRLLGPVFIRRFYGQLINIHPSLLPKYPGLNTHEQAITAGDKVHGVSIHFVDEGMDAGPLIAQAEVTIASADTPALLKDKIHRLEHVIYPQVISWFAERRLKLVGRIVLLDGQPLARQGYFFR